MQAKSIVISQWKLINELKCYFSKFTTDKSFEKVLNQQFAKFLQKIDPTTFGKDFRYFASPTATPVPKSTPTSDTKQESNNAGSSIPSILTGLIVNGVSREEVKKETVPKWKKAKPVISMVNSIC